MELSEYLRDVAFGTVTNHLRPHHVIDGVQMYARLEEDGTLLLGTTRHDASYGTFRLSINVEALGPENDPVLIEEMRAEPEWTPATWGQVMTGDRVRLSGQEADVQTCARLNWHADNTDSYRPKPWPHTVMRVKLAHLEQALDFPAGDAVEILADAERRTFLIMSSAFLGSEPMEAIMEASLDRDQADSERRPRRRGKGITSRE